MCTAVSSLSRALTCDLISNPSSLQLQHHEAIPEAATYSSVRPYRESPLLARARRTESFHSYRDFQSLHLHRSLERAGPGPEDAGPGPSQAEAKRAAGGCAGPEAAALGAEARGAREADTHGAAEAGPEAKRRAPEDDGDPGEPRRKGGFDGGGFLGRKKGPHLASSPSTSDGGTDSPGTASPSPTKTTPSPRHKKSDSSGQEYSL